MARADRWLDARAGILVNGLPRQIAERFSTSERIEMLRRKALEARPFVCAERARLFTEAYRESEDQPPVMRKALALTRVLEKMTIYIHDGELVVGNNSSGPRGSVIAPEYSAAWLAREMDDPVRSPDRRPQDTHVFSDVTKAVLRNEVLPYWLGRTTEDRVISMLPERIVELGIASAGRIPSTPVAPEIYIRNGIGHVIVDYGRLLDRGFAGQLGEARRQMSELPLALPGNLDRWCFFRAVATVYEAVIAWIGRYERLASELSHSCTSDGRRKELLRIADDCRWIAENAPATFRQAVQTWFFAELVLFGLEQNATAVSPGRFDQYMDRFYREDLRRGDISREEALELIECLFIKLSEMSILWDFDSASYWSGFSMTLCLVVGGVDESGKDVTNELSHLVLEADRNLGLLQPETAVRVHAGSPPELLLEAVRIVRLGRGKPKFFMDSCAIAMLQNLGIGLAEARDYGVVGCVELTPTKNTAGYTGAVFINLAKCLEAALNNGRCLLTGAEIGPGDEPHANGESYERIRERFRQQVVYAIENAVIVMNAVAEVHARDCPCAFTSSLIRGCLESGRDFTEGGAEHSFIGISGVGLPNVANSLLALKRVVFEEHALSLSELVEALRNDFKEHEELRLRLWNRIPKYGNDNDEVDAIAREEGRFFCREVSRHCTRFGHRFRPGLFAVSINVPFGLTTGATAEGRKARRPLVDGGISPCAGTERRGITAVICSAAKIDSIMAGNGTLLNIRLLPSVLESENDVAQIVNVLLAYHDLGGYHIQFNVIDDQTLRHAQQSPEEYRGLMVRVAGYSAYFVELNPEVQEDIISRTAHGRAEIQKRRTQ
jgi:pyruvate formate-lyase/glycerol dehydratase family glycyl radical enzyme